MDVKQSVRGIAIVILQIQYLILAGIGVYALALYFSKEEVKEVVNKQFGVQEYRIDTIYLNTKNKYLMRNKDKE